MSPYYQDDTTTIHHGDCIEAMQALPDNSVDSIVTDPPYGLGFMGKEWDALPPGKEWAEQCLRILKPGGHLLAFGGTRTWHRLAVSIEDAGFEIRDSFAWLYGSGFPKSQNLGKRLPEWDGWGTALKPAFEPVVMARKPFKGSVAGNVLKYGAGALNIAGGRLPHTTINGGNLADNPHLRGTKVRGPGVSTGFGKGGEVTNLTEQSGRYPSNVLLDDTQAAALDEQSGVLTSGKMKGGTVRAARDPEIYGRIGGPATEADTPGDSGGASRFFYCAKAPKSERPIVDGVAHTTVKPLTLMRYLIRMVTPPGGTTLDTFAGSGTSIEAAILEGFNTIGIERESDYLPLIQARIDRAKDEAPQLFGDAA